ncbi:MAG: acetyl-CoA carboxylase biotin carboxyl carrier protein subunit [Alphaproteobacteria bacterium]|nr:acetyl-CoA carboxylase biotin carboxyl carrier protein subunit [Alphaproteobacteria bacterium]
MKLQIAIDNKKFDLEVEVLEEDTPHKVRGYIPPFPVVTMHSLAGPTTAQPAEVAATGPVDEGKVCRSPVAGMVIRIDVQVGQQVQVDDLIMVLEAMKMETNVTAAFAGKVKAIKVAKGDGVKLNQVLVEFE